MGLLPILALSILVSSPTAAQISVNQGVECDVNDPLSCNKNLLEVCVFSDSTYRCLCPPGIARLDSTGKCSVRNECNDRTLHDCHAEADCFDSLEGYDCQCKIGYTDLSPDPSRRGRVCRQKVDECANPTRYRVNCHRNAVCQDTEDSYLCACLPGYVDVSHYYNQLPGRTCVADVNECVTGTHQCSANAQCDNFAEGYNCRCLPGYVDASPNIAQYPGRVCNLPPASIAQAAGQTKRCTPGANQCSRAETCEYGPDGWYTCQCANNAFRFEDGFCKYIDACSQQSECDSNAICTNVFDSFHCQCRPGFADISPDPVSKPGRVCKELRNECGLRTNNDCSPYASCVDTQDGYQCVCQSGFMDVSSVERLPPGRKCAQSSNECAHASLNSCDDNAQCVDLPGSYTCQCRPGFVDVSTSANLPYGRVCTIHTDCPKQKADLIFLIDGSGSIGSSTFRNEVLRFIAEFSELFDIGLDKTRIGAIQFSGEAKWFRRIEFRLDQYQDRRSLNRAIQNITYLSGTTFTGSAIRFMTDQGFTIYGGARPRSDQVARIAIVITDGQSQEPVKADADNARRAGIELFGIGVTAHVDPVQMVEIAGHKDRYFHVHDFKDLDVKLRSAIQKLACPGGNERPGTCDGGAGCNRALNEECKWDGSRYFCGCPSGFIRNPVTQICGGDRCNPQIPGQCPYPSVCTKTPFGIHRCACPTGYRRHTETGFCTNKPDGGANRICFGVSDTKSCAPNEICAQDNRGLFKCICGIGLVRNPFTDTCIIPGQCDPAFPLMCDQNKQEKCLPDNSLGYHTCQCPPYFQRHSITGVCLLDECANRQNDCSPYADCIDTDLGYSCQCRAEYIDISPNRVSEPGRVCKQRINECLTGTHNCSRNANCYDTEFAFRCQCKQGYIDLSPNLRAFYGVKCEPETDECALRIHDCSPNADCTDTLASYKCACRTGFRDLDLLRNPGRRCEAISTPAPIPHPCEEGGTNDCSQFAHCIRSSGRNFLCECFDGYDDTGNPPGRYCVQKATPPPGSEECGNSYCYRAKNEECKQNQCVCISGYQKVQGSTCLRVVGFPQTLWLMRRNEVPYYWSPEYGNPQSQKYGDLVKEWEQGVEGTMERTQLRYAFAGSQVDWMGNPRKQNLNRDQGIIVNFTVYLTDGSADSNALSQGLWESIVQTNYSLGNTPLYVNRFYGPKDPHPAGQWCGDDVYCFDKNNEFCRSEDNTCVCPPGHQRREPQGKCIAVDGYNMILWVKRHGQFPHNWNRSFTEPNSEAYRYFGEIFGKGVEQTYEYTPHEPYYVNTVVNEYQEPNKIRKTWGDDGVVYNFTTYFEKGNIKDGATAWTSLMEYIRKFRNEVGRSSLFVSDEQLNVYSVCFKHTCDDVAICTPTPKAQNPYKCRCPDGYEEQDADRRGGKCVSIINYCEDIFCPGNMTCVNNPILGEGECICDPLKGEGFVNIRKANANRRLELKLSGIGCLHTRDVPFCELGSPLIDCSPIAECTNAPSTPAGYYCKCPIDSVDEEPTNPGRICSASPLTGCGFCSFHGDCNDDIFSANKTCSCFDGWTGPKCAVQKAAVVAGGGWPSWAIALLILAILLLLLALACLGYFCSLLRCCGCGAKTGSTGAIVAGGDYGSDYYGQYGQMSIPRPKLRREYEEDLSIDYSDASSDYTVVERRVVTEEKRVVNVLPNTGAQAQAMYILPAGEQGAQMAAEMLQTNSSEQRQMIGGATSGASATYATAHSSSAQHGQFQDRELTEYEEMGTEDSRSLPSDAEDDDGATKQGVFDKKTTVKHSRDWVPNEGARGGGLERYTTEHSTTRTATNPPGVHQTTATLTRY